MDKKETTPEVSRKAIEKQLAQLKGMSYDTHRDLNAIQKRANQLDAMILELEATLANLPKEETEEELEEVETEEVVEEKPAKEEKKEEKSK